MIHLAVFMGFMALTHILYLAAITEQKYSIKKIIPIYAVFGAFFIGFVLGDFCVIRNILLYELRSYRRIHFPVCCPDADLLFGAVGYIRDNSAYER